MSLGMHEILPDGGLASFQNHVSRIADLGRYEDAYIVHAAEGETVVPMAVFDENPRLKAMLFAQMRGMGIDPERYIVGNELNSINPVTGQPEFFLKQIFKSAKKALKKIAPYAGTIAGLAGAGPWASAAIGAGVPLLMGEDAGAALAGGIGGYGAGSAFGTAEMFGGTKGEYALPHLFKDQGGIGAAFDRVKSNLGFSAPTSGTKLTAAQADMAGEGAKVGTSVADLTSSQKDTLKEFGWTFKHGEIVNPASANFEPWAKTAAMFAPLAVSGGDEDQRPPSGWDDIYPKQPWYGNWAADGGIINAYDNGGPVDRHPGMDEGYQFDFDVDGENRTYSFDEQGLTDEAKAAFLAREGITPDTKSEFLARGEITPMMVERLARAMKSSGRIDDNDRARALEILQTGNPEMINAMMEKSERDKQMINEFRNIGEEGSPHDYTEDKYADGGIAHLAGGSFPRMTGAISGPGGPRDDMVPAMLSDGEFVMTADAVRNAGGGNRREGARRMYQLMNQLQGVA